MKSRGKIVDIFEVESRFSDAVDRVVETGRSLTVTRYGVPVVDIVPSSRARTTRMSKRRLAALGVLRLDVAPMIFDEIRSMIGEGRSRFQEP